RATALADISGARVALTLSWHTDRERIHNVRCAAVFEPYASRRLIQVNVQFVVRTACLLLSMAWFTHLGRQQGDALLAANAILLNFLSFASYGLDGFAHAAETLSGAAIGKRDPARLSRVIKICYVWGLVSALLYMAVYAVLGEHLIRVLTDQLEIARVADRYLIWAVLAPVLSLPAYLYDGVFMGATQTRPLMWIMIACS